MAAVPAGRPIFLTGTHRSGTTWLAQMLAASGIWYIHEPYAPMKGRWPRAFDFRRSEEPDAKVDAIFEDILGGGFREALNLPNSDHPWMPLRLFRPRFNRLLVKDPLACLLTEYLTRRFQLQTLILFRHPAGFVSSIQRLGWPRASFLRQFLEDEPLMAAHLEPCRATLERCARADDLEAAAALCGALNRVLWRFAAAGVGTAVSFEELCSDPIPRLRHLFMQLGLPYDEGVRDAHVAACLGRAKPSSAYHPHAVNRNSLAMAGAWKAELGAAERARVRVVWEQFDVPLYRADADWAVASGPDGST